MSETVGDAEAQANAARVLAYHRGQHADCVTCRLMGERDDAEAERDQLRKRVASLEAVVKRVPEWRLLSTDDVFGRLALANQKGQRRLLHCAVCGTDADKGHAADCPWLGLRETTQSEVSL